MKIVRLLILVAAVIGMVAPFAAAQNSPANFLNVLTVTVNGGKAAQFENFAKRVRSAAEQIGNSQTVLIAQSRLGGPNNQYLVVIPFNEWDELDTAPSVAETLAEAFGDDEAMKIGAMGGEAIAMIENAVGRFRPEFSSNASAAPLGQRYAFLVTTEIDPAQQDAYELFLRSLKAAEDKAGIRRVRRTTAMGAAFRHTALWQVDSLAQGNSVPGPGTLLRDEYGTERAHAISEGARRAVRGRTFTVLELRPDLSSNLN